MTKPRGTASAASRVFVTVVIAVAVVGALLATVIIIDAQRTERTEAETLSAAIAGSIAIMPDVAAALSSDDASTTLQPIAQRIMTDADVDFVTIMTPAGTRVTHRDPEQIGLHYLGTIPAEPVALTEEFVGTLGPSVRTIVPISADGELVGWVSVGVTTGAIASGLLPRIPFAIGVALAVLAAGVAGAVIARRLTRQVAGDLPAGGIRDAISSYESVRTLAQALRSQTHEHGNRMHTAVALLELGRTDEAIELLTEHSRESQDLVDLVTAGDGDPAVGALLLGKASQARERGVEWSVTIEPGTPATALSTMDAVSVIGNLIDNAIDAAAAGSEPRWVSVALGADRVGSVTIAVGDSGDGVPDALRDRVFEHGFSTKPSDADGRGVGLALASSIAEDAGGSVALAPGTPTTFIATLPAATT